MNGQQFAGYDDFNEAIEANSEKAGYGTADDGRAESGGVIDRLLSLGRSG